MIGLIPSSQVGHQEPRIQTASVEEKFRMGHGREWQMAMPDLRQGKASSEVTRSRIFVDFKLEL